MTFAQWYERLQQLFQEELGRDPSTAGWVWEAVFEEQLTPEQAFEDYAATL